MKELVIVWVEGKGTMRGKRRGIHQMKSRIREKVKTIRNRMGEKLKRRLKESC